jgi:ubiquinone/menaquinone biosynthesis C-methylase UbiE
MGGEVANYLRWGARLADLTGVDLMHHRLQTARDRTGLAAVQASGSQLPFAGAQFDVVCQNVVFSSIVDPLLRVEVAQDMRRVLKPGGWLLWYDAERTRGGDAHFLPVPRAEVRRLFPGVKWRWRRLTTDLGLIRRAHALFGAAGMYGVEATGCFKTHLLGLGQA